MQWLLLDKDCRAKPGPSNLCDWLPISTSCSVGDRPVSRISSTLSLDLFGLENLPGQQSGCTAAESDDHSVPAHARSVFGIFFWRSPSPSPLLWAEVLLWQMPEVKGHGKCERKCSRRETGFKQWMSSLASINKKRSPYQQAQCFSTTIRITVIGTNVCTFVIN